jgi:hypothetical protein
LEGQVRRVTAGTTIGTESYRFSLLTLEYLEGQTTGAMNLVLQVSVMLVQARQQRWSHPWACRDDASPQPVSLVEHDRLAPKRSERPLGKPAHTRCRIELEEHHDILADFERLRLRITICCRAELKATFSHLPADPLYDDVCRFAGSGGRHRLLRFDKTSRRDHVIGDDVRLIRPEMRLRIGDSALEARHRTAPRVQASS